MEDSLDVFKMIDVDMDLPEWLEQDYKKVRLYEFGKRLFDTSYE